MHQGYSLLHRKPPPNIISTIKNSLIIFFFYKIYDNHVNFFKSFEVQFFKTVFLLNGVYTVNLSSTMHNILNHFHKEYAARRRRLNLILIKVFNNYMIILLNQNDISIRNDILIKYKKHMYFYYFNSKTNNCRYSELSQNVRITLFEYFQFFFQLLAIKKNPYDIKISYNYVNCFCSFIKIFKIHIHTLFL
ncbi:hypothetical protein AGLY_011942 [Aphis glycines]|uniref:Uncharacterized protein n=1 Tax=Aphis glycines TaxID=307491 RepID=A0A6G0TCU3_APHGL|nr:hypothetical protein AGLY_011942 [Aphis glycines]